MKNNNYIKSLLFIVLWIVSGVNAAPVAINSMFVDSATVNLNAGILGNASASAQLPNIEITMGIYQSDIFTISNTGLTVNIYSTDFYGRSAPSGYVDGALINVDFSSLRADVSYGSYAFDVELWPLTTTLDYGSYDPMSGDYLIGWSETISVDVSSFFSYAATLDVELGGYLTAVPLPAAVWLFGSGLIALFGYAGSKRKKY